MKNFTGPVQARNFEIFRELLDKNHMLDQAHDFFRASGALTAIEYKDVIEAQLRTYLKGGFQLLSLNDFTGQGYAPVGILDPFWNTKGSSHRKSGASSVHRLSHCSVSTNAHFTMMKCLKEKRKYTIMDLPIEKRKNQLEDHRQQR